MWWINMNHIASVTSSVGGAVALKCEGSNLIECGGTHYRFNVD